MWLCCDGGCISSACWFQLWSLLLPPLSHPSLWWQPTGRSSHDGPGSTTVWIFVTVVSILIMNRGTMLWIFSYKRGLYELKFQQKNSHWSLQPNILHNTHMIGIRSHLVHLPIGPIAHNLNQLKDSCWILHRRQTDSEIRAFKDMRTLV